MVKEFADDATNASRSLQCYLVLIGCAHRRETITYRGLAKLLGYEKPEGGRGSTGAGVVGHRLDDLMRWCRQEGVPPLTSIVVNEETGLPGSGLGIAPEDVPVAHR